MSSKWDIKIYIIYLNVDMFYVIYTVMKFPKH